MRTSSSNRPKTVCRYGLRVQRGLVWQSRGLVWQSRGMVCQTRRSNRDYIRDYRRNHSYKNYRDRTPAAPGVHFNFVFCRRRELVCASFIATRWLKTSIILRPESWRVKPVTATRSSATKGESCQRLSHSLIMARRKLRCDGDCCYDSHPRTTSV